MIPTVLGVDWSAAERGVRKKIFLEWAARIPPHLQLTIIDDPDPPDGRRVRRLPRLEG